MWICSDRLTKVLRIAGVRLERGTVFENLRWMGIRPKGEGDRDIVRHALVAAFEGGARKSVGWWRLFGGGTGDLERARREDAEVSEL